MDANAEMMDLYIARQPVFDQSLKLFGYELLYRENDQANVTAIKDSNQATAQVITMGVIEIGLEKLIGNSKAFLNLSYDYLVGEPELNFPKNNIVLEIPVDIRIDEPLIAACKRLFEKGYTLALNDIYPDADTLQLLPYCHIVKIDIQKTPAEQLLPLVNKLKGFHIKLLALRVEDCSQVSDLIDMGFEYLQGFFFCKPLLMNHKHLSTNQLSILDLLSNVYDDEIEPDDLVEIISRDVSLSYHLLRYLNSAFFQLPQKVESMHQAIIYLGRNELKTWATIISMAGNNEKPDELMKLAMIRAKMCEILGDQSHPGQKDSFFTVGLLSSLDALMDQSMSTILQELPLSDEVQQALLEHTGPMGEALECNLNFEQCNWDTIKFSHSSLSELNQFYLEAIAWADNALSNMQ